jgi:hypothetical protein
MLHRPLALIAAAVSGLLAVAGCGSGTDGPFAPKGYYAGSAEPRRLTLVIEWNEAGWCAGQFDVSLDETDEAVIVRSVTTDEGDEDCAGLGTVNNEAQAEVLLRRPLAGREVRTKDGTLLKLRARL